MIAGADKMENSSTNTTNIYKEVDELSINTVDIDKIDYLDIGKKEAIEAIVYNNSRIATLNNLNLSVLLFAID